MNRIDLHIHSSCSDSSLDVAHIIALAREQHMQTISITDHDTFAAYKQLKHKELPCTVIKGIEISAYDQAAKKAGAYPGLWLWRTDPACGCPV